jgi:hypothetical protein
MLSLLFFCDQGTAFRLWVHLAQWFPGCEVCFVDKAGRFRSSKVARICATLVSLEPESQCALLVGAPFSYEVKDIYRRVQGLPER